ncbi:hypothetical protein RHMOL_Rhmol09G0224400 [Rhododendron molle]|uniref:Uncharacterized protein n=1 Tax=Rhododendron molle TaxID=49168 RepID=A0ACC0MG64_RHOML|nr:hypothetical protein RHMOL_Rhmol09G0224400 [Rhododendron molle]
MNCGVCAAAATGDFWARMGGGGGGGGGFSHESEHDLAAMVSDFLENNGSSGGTDYSRYCSSDSDSGLCDLAYLAHNISYYKLSVDQYESDLLAVVNSLMLSMSGTDLHLVKSGPCNASCIRFSLVKLLRLSGYDAAVCSSKWQGNGKVPGGDHEYIDVVNYKASGGLERLIIDIDFRSHFEIARAVESYERLLSSLPVVYVGSTKKLKKFLQVMVEAARSSLKQNSMPLPPWRSLAYLQAKWHSSYERQLIPDGLKRTTSEHKQFGFITVMLLRIRGALALKIKLEIGMVKHSFAICQGMFKFVELDINCI